MLNYRNFSRVVLSDLFNAIEVDFKTFDFEVSEIAADILDRVLMNSARSAPTLPLKVLWLSS